MVGDMEIQPSAIYLFVVKNPGVTTVGICDHFRADFTKIMPLLANMKRSGVLNQSYAYPGKISVWSVNR